VDSLPANANWLQVHGLGADVGLSIPSGSVYTSRRRGGSRAPPPRS